MTPIFNSTPLPDGKGLFSTLPSLAFFVVEDDNHSVLPTILEEEDYILGETISVIPHLKVYSFTQREMLFISASEFHSI